MEATHPKVTHTVEARGLMGLPLQLLLELEQVHRGGPMGLMEPQGMVGSTAMGLVEHLGVMEDSLMEVILMGEHLMEVILMEVILMEDSLMEDLTDTTLLQGTFLLALTQRRTSGSRASMPITADSSTQRS